MKKRLYFVGIGGIAMANLACLLKKKGYIVSGSDAEVFGPSKKLLEKNEIKFFSSYRRKNIAILYPTMAVIGNAIGRGNPELEFILNNNIPYCSMPEIIKSELLPNKIPVVIAGTSGKTTTTALIGWILHEAKLKPTIFTGGIMKNFESGFFNGNSKHIIIEGDEYNSSFYDTNPKFLHYKPYHTIITNIQPDHLDIYGTLENIVKAFKKLVKIVPSEGSLILNSVDPNSKAIAKNSRSKIIHFGQKGDIKANNIKLTPEGIAFNAYERSKKLGQIKSPLLGKHNVENILAAIALALDLKISFKKIAGAMESFKGVKRRLEIIYPVRSSRASGPKGTRDKVASETSNGIAIIDDFAHNPDKVLASLSALRNHFPKHKIIAIFEPRTGSSRRNFFQKTYPPSFKPADLVYIADAYRKNVLDRKEIFSSKKLALDLNKKGTESYALKNADTIIKHIKSNILKPNHLEPSAYPIIFCIMTSGDFDGIHQKLIKLIS